MSTHKIVFLLELSGLGSALDCTGGGGSGAVPTNSESVSSRLDNIEGWFVGDDDGDIEGQTVDESTAVMFEDEDGVLEKEILGVLDGRSWGGLEGLDFGFNEGTLVGHPVGPFVAVEVFSFVGDVVGA